MFYEKIYFSKQKKIREKWHLFYTLSKIAAKRRQLDSLLCIYYVVISYII